MTDTPTPRQVLQKLLDGVSAGQWGELAALYAPDTVVEHPLARDHTRMLRGRDTLAAHFDRIAATGLCLTAGAPAFHDVTDPDLVIAEFIYSASASDGRTFDVPACFIWRVEQGLITHARDYLGTLSTP
ncbi:nuclear transport factor 2 family protein [Mycolicibacterium smegmatis]|uniref:SnoaL-like domain-containing protein n=4 Tax=Mycolicibacterium smegmatis TaxID=1772 RepID=A0R766_MYCS2|nr:nuclear transport factor 2 family protein [Mycolicibacterium smegmatis]ABK71264.1 hypothetical protein MSMEG_6796 [Mycolicibacterium smegmatis MC2 155]AFP43039.1 hypothetical protein MSMEI_6613 [Mycolicibacterium smegmatis MC2 155]AIU11761.1 hypothetical protein LJ00_33580 [Mycolicibacterium smegmatis MC2 155]AIU18386.1 hypothetical protein LI99_33585 [Mycolicibacterium smegmatis]AIU25008.1 hypothetical protein LI98_33590 [Mycolicibacterium smegmatis]